MNVLADAASIASECHSATSCTSETLAAPKTTEAKKKSPNLPRTLMKLLNDESAPDAIWWLPGEKEFAINADIFPKQVLEVYFPGSKYASFIRRLHKLGFSRQTRTLKKVYGSLPEHAVAFRHELFQKERPELLDQLKNGYWKELKARKARRAAANTDAVSVTSSSARSPSPPAVVETVSIMPPVSAISLPQMISSTITPSVGLQRPEAVTPEGKAPTTATNNTSCLMLYLQNLQEQREVEDRLQFLLHQRQQLSEEEGDQLYMEHVQQMALQRQRMMRQEAQMVSSLYPIMMPLQQPEGAYSSYGTPSDTTLLRLRMRVPQP